VEKALRRIAWRPNKPLMAQPPLIICRIKSVDSTALSADSMLLAVGAVHHQLIRGGKRMRVQHYYLAKPRGAKTRWVAAGLRGAEIGPYGASCLWGPYLGSTKTTCGEVFLSGGIPRKKE